MFHRHSDTNTPPQSFQESMSITQLTSSGDIGAATISPDGKWLAYVQDRKGQQSIWVRQVATGSMAQVLPPSEIKSRRSRRLPAMEIISISTPDTSGRANEPLAENGVARRRSAAILDDIDSPISFSPDGSQIAFVRDSIRGTESSKLMVAAADGSGQHTLSTLTRPQHSFSLNGPAWSPDGARIAVGAIEGQGSTIHWHIHLVDTKIRHHHSSRRRHLGESAPIRLAS